MFLTLFKNYLIAFATMLVGYTSLNWLISTKLYAGINQNYTDIWLPLAICIAITYFYLRPTVNKLQYSEKGKDFLLFFILPFTLWTPVIFSQNYIKDISYKIVSINKPSDLFAHPHERFFKIRSLVVESENHYLIREQHTSGRYGTTLNLSNYYVAPLYDDTIESENSLAKIGYGVKFTTSMHNGFFDEKIQTPLIKEFNSKSEIDYKNFDFYDVNYFEKMENSDDADLFAKAVHFNNNFDDKRKIPVLVKRNGSIYDLYAKNKNKFLYSTFISLGIGLLSLILMNLWHHQK